MDNNNYTIKDTIQQFLFDLSLNLPFTKLLKWWPYHSPFTDNTVSPNSNIG